MVVLQIFMEGETRWLYLCMGSMGFDSPPEDMGRLGISNFNFFSTALVDKMGW